MPLNCPTFTRLSLGLLAVPLSNFREVRMGMVGLPSKRQRRVLALVSGLLGALLLSGCAGGGHYRRELPPVLSQDQFPREFVKIGQVTVTRERYGSPEALGPADYEWAYQALREEAAKIDADAVILPEVKVQSSTYLLFPSSEIAARATAIRFR